MNTSNSEDMVALEKALREERAARQRAEAELAAERDARLEFVSLVTHELRVPMTSIKGYTDLLLKGIVGPVNDAQSNFLQTVRSNVERMSRMVADLSDINKIAAGRLTLNMDDVPLQDVLDEVVATYEARAQQKSQTLQVNLPEELPAVRGDRERLVQVFGNVLSNAIQYTPEGGELRIHLEGDEGEAEEQVCVAVTDTGYGIPEEEQEHIFELFFRASDEETRSTPGNGLALHLTRHLLALHQGSISFTSKRGAGSTFFIELPVAAPY